MTGSVYVLADTSGSTVRDGFNEGWHLALPRLVALAEASGPDSRICFLSYDDEAQMRMPLIKAQDVTMIPWMPPGGLSSLASGLHLLARTTREDRQQLGTDGIPIGSVATLVVAHGLPTDSDDDVLAARESVQGELYVTAPLDGDRLAYAGLRASVHPMSTGTPGRVARSIIEAARRAWHGSGGPE